MKSTDIVVIGFTKAAAEHWANELRMVLGLDKMPQSFTMERLPKHYIGTTVYVIDGGRLTCKVLDSWAHWRRGAKMVGLNLKTQADIEQLREVHERGFAAGMDFEKTDKPFRDRARAGEYDR